MPQIKLFHNKSPFSNLNSSSAKYILPMNLSKLNKLKELIKSKGRNKNA